MNFIGEQMFGSCGALKNGIVWRQHQGVISEYIGEARSVC